MFQIVKRWLSGRTEEAEPKPSTVWVSLHDESGAELSPREPDPHQTWPPVPAYRRARYVVGSGSQMTFGVPGHTVVDAFALWSRPVGGDKLDGGLLYSQQEFNGPGLMHLTLGDVPQDRRPRTFATPPARKG